MLPLMMMMMIDDDNVAQFFGITTLQHSLALAKLGLQIPTSLRSSSRKRRELWSLGKVLRV
jgi:hypothetical protein